MRYGQAVERDRDLLYFKYRLDLSAPDICRTMGIKPESFYQALSKARKRLCKIMEQEGGFID